MAKKYRAASLFENLERMAALGDSLRRSFGMLSKIAKIIRI
jgi:hypothetical protein